LFSSCSCWLLRSIMAFLRIPSGRRSDLSVLAAGGFLAQLPTRFPWTCWRCGCVQALPCRPCPGECFCSGPAAGAGPASPSPPSPSALGRAWFPSLLPRCFGTRPNSGSQCSFQLVPLADQYSPPPRSRSAWHALCQLCL